MKIIALLPFRNESWILPTYLKNVLPIVDEVIAIDDYSTDGGKEILEKESKVKVYSNNETLKSGWAEFNIRQKLLELGREAGGTHFVCLDADETFTTNFVPLAKKVISKLEPGQKLSLQWLALWKSADHYRDDNSVWSNNFKDFVVHDDGKISHVHPGNTIGVGRTPGLNTNENWLKLNNKYGAVLHYQFSNWRNFQLKQAWYRCSEKIMNAGNAQSINQKYSITLDDPNTFVKSCPHEWVNGLPNLDIQNLPISWHLEKIKEFFNEYGPNYFNDLNIWHIQEIKDLVN
jgi:glycosyltransferase involved in cell wall biosynthesis